MAFALDGAANFAKADLSTGYTSSATSIVLVSGGGARMPAVRFNATWYNSTDYADPADDPSVEIIRVTSVATDTLTITRAQESTSAANHNTAGKTYTLVAGPTALRVTEMRSLNPSTTKGDLLTFGTVPTALAVGSDGQAPIADSAAATGLSYKGALVQIAKITTSASQATVDFTSIPANYTDLVVMWQARSNVSGVNEAMSLKFNNDGTSGNYTITEWWQSYATGSGTGSTAASASGLFALQVTGGTAPSSHAASGTVTITNYLGTTFYKGMLSTGQFQQAAGTSQQLTQQTSGVWKNTAAVTRLTFSVPTSFVNGSVFTLYGVGTP